MAIWNRLQGLVFGAAIARAGSDAVTPVLEPVRQHAWTKNQLRVIGPELAARLLAQGLLPEHDAIEESSRSGYNANRLAALVLLAQTAPDVAEALTMYRRGKIDRERLHESFAKHQLEPKWWDALEELAVTYLSPAEVANAVQQGHLPNPDVLPDPGPPTSPPAGYEQPTAPDGVPATDVPLTQIQLDPLAEAAAAGVDLDRLRVEANLAGLPPGPELLLAMRNRNLITEESLDAGLREGHLKTKWMQAYKRMRWAILSPQEAASARLRTWIDAEQSYEIGRQHGLSPEQMDLMFLNRGRPASPTQMWRAWARKATGPRGVPVSYEDHAKAIAISDIRPEYAEMLWQIRYNFPSLFQLDRLVSSGTVDAETAAQWAEWNLYAPEVVKALRASWAHPHSAAAKTATKAELDTEYEAGLATEAEFRVALANLGYHDAAQDLEVQLGDARRLRKYREAAVSAIGKAYLAHAIDDATAISQLAEAHVTGEPARMQLRWWALERLVTVRELTDAQLVKAASNGIITTDVALERLRDLGLSAADAQIRLEEG